MDDHRLERMRTRARAVAARAAVRRWNYRQRNLAAGVWYRLRRVLADAEAAYAISEEDADRLIALGYTPEPCGREIAPEKRIFFVEPERPATLESGRRIRVDLGPDFLAASSIALVAFRGNTADRSASRSADGPSCGVEAGSAPHPDRSAEGPVRTE